jgi:hypothetical protein
MRSRQFDRAMTTSGFRRTVIAALAEPCVPESRASVVRDRCETVDPGRPHRGTALPTRLLFRGPSLDRGQPDRAIRERAVRRSTKRPLFPRCHVWIHLRERVFTSKRGACPLPLGRCPLPGRRPRSCKRVHHEAENHCFPGKRENQVGRLRLLGPLETCGPGEINCSG